MKQPIKPNSSSSQSVMLSDEQSLIFFSQDFGKLIIKKPQGVFVPSSVAELQDLLQYAQQQQIPITIRGNGLSQSGQALVCEQGMIVHMEQFNQVLTLENSTIWIEANASWSSLLEKTLEYQLIPPVIPYNCQLSIAGVLSAGGIGASSFAFGSVVDHVLALEVVTADGALHKVDATMPLFHACLGGQGRFGVITKACLQLKPCAAKVRTFFLLYLDAELWLRDLARCQEKADFIEGFCTPAIQGAKLTTQGRFPFAQWFYSLQITMEYEGEALPQLDKQLNPWRVIHVQEEAMHDFLHRHDGRFAGMKRMGLWELVHPWYECFIDKSGLDIELPNILNTLPLHYATVVQIVPIHSNKKEHFFMLPDAEKVVAFMILNAGLSESLVPSALQCMQTLDQLFLPRGGKRYLSGFLGESVDEAYWRQHFAKKYKSWLKLKEQFDPENLLCSFLHKSNGQDL